MNFQASCLPWVPEQGTVGASGDLAPLSHLALGLMGEGHMWSPQTGWGDAKYVSTWSKLIDSKHDALPLCVVKLYNMLKDLICFYYIFQVLESHNLSPIKLQAKEGLAMINGTQLITSIGNITWNGNQYINNQQSILFYRILFIINLTQFLGAEALERAGIIARQADVVAGLTLEVLKGTSRAFDSGKHSYWYIIRLKS